MGKVTGSSPVETTNLLVQHNRDDQFIGPTQANHQSRMTLKENYLQHQPTPPIEIPLDRLSAEVLDSLIESFVLREGTDYGAYEFSLDQKKSQVAKQLQAGRIKIVFDPDSESVTLMTKEEWSRL